MNNSLLKRVKNSDFLSNRLNFNAKYSKADFFSWLYEHLSKIKFNTVLDVGCGNGEQTKWLAEKFACVTKIYALDISDKAIKHIDSISKKFKKIEAGIGDMDDLINCASKHFDIKQFDLIFCSYALYYAKNPHNVLQQMLELLSESGSVAICGPYLINTLLNFLAKYQSIPKLSWDCLEFINDYVLNFCYRHFENTKTHVFINHLFVTDIAGFAEYYRSSTFYCEKAEKEILKAVDTIIKRYDSFHIQKNAKLIIASKPFKNKI